MKIDNDYALIRSKIITYLPSDSVIGRLLAQNNEKVIVKSSIRGIKSPDVYNWQIEKNYFILSKLSLDSDIIKNVIDEFLSKVSYENREMFICDIYDIITKAGIKKSMT